jgi:hypothetical protein
MNGLNFYSFINDFDDFLDCAEGIDNIEFSEPPIEFSHWCSQSDTENPDWHCLDCCYIRKYHVRDYYVVISNKNIGLYDTNGCLSFYCSEKLNFACLLFHFKIKDGKKYVYISLNYIKPINNVFEEYIRGIYFNEKSIRDILNELVKTVEQ